MRRKLLLGLLILGTNMMVTAQVLINNVTPLNTFNNDTIVITGSGFSATMTSLEVWFGSVKGTIIASSEFAIEVKVPAEARATNVEVINKATNLSAKSKLKFIPTLKTEAFSVSKFVQAVSITPLASGAQNELWDLCVCDLNADGKPDIASTKFQRPSTPYQAGSDIMVLQNQSTPGTLSFTKKDKNNLATLNLGFPSDNVVCGDLNADGKPELVVSRAGSTRNSIHIFNNTSAGAVLNFAPQSSQTTLFLTVGDVATRIVIRDLNRDGKPELVVTNSSNDFFYIFVNQSSGGTLSFNATPVKLDIEPSGIGSFPTYDVEVQDFNGDGWPDIIINRFVGNNFYIFKNLGSGSISFAAPVMHSTAANDVVFNRVTTADFNNDGKLDLIFTNSSLTGAKTSAIYLNQSTATNIAFASDASAIKFTASPGAWGIDVGDIDGDKDVDFVVATKDANELNVFLHDGNFTTPGFTKFVIPLTTPIPWNPRNIKLGDLDGDGKPEIAFTAQSDATATTAIEVLQNIHCHQPEIENPDDTKICTGQTIVLKTIPANNVTFAWTKDGGAVGTNSPYLTITAPGTYRVTNTTGGCNLFDEIVVAPDAGVFPSDPVITGNTPLCVGATLNLSTSTTGDTYTWTKPNGTTLTGQNQSFPVTLDDGGMYSLLITKGVCRSDVATKRIDVATLANFVIVSNPTNNTVCQGGTVQLSVSNVANHTYQWKKDGVDISGQTTPNLSVTQEGSYSVKVTNVTLSCDTETSPVQVIVLTTPVANYTVDATACTGEVLTFTNQSTVDSRATVVYNWNFGDGNTSTDTSPTKSYATAQTFNSSLAVSYSGVSGGGCSNNTSKPIVVTASVQPTITSPASSLCPDEATTLSITGTYTTILWSNNATTLTTTITGPGTYTVATTDVNGCPGQDDIIMNAKAVPTLTVTAVPTTIPSGATSQLTASGADTYAWLPIESLDNPAISNPIASPSQTTSYTVTGSVTGGCSDNAEIIVTVEGVLGFPVAFSPNGDGINDEWNIRAQDKPDCTLSIFDSKGRRIFEAKGENWDGTYQGKSVPEGTYYYVFGCPTEKAITGNVLIIR